MRFVFALALTTLAAACAPAKAPPPAEEQARVEPTRQEDESVKPRGASPEVRQRGEAPPPVAGKDYDLVVHFKSTGSGTDRDARARVDALFDATPGLGRAHGRWGREGEVDECADLDRLAPAERAALVARVRGSMQNATNTDVFEHHPCAHDFSVAETRFEVVVEFISIGTGTDGKAEDALDGIAKSWPKVQHASYAWGREGEHNECFSFGNAQDARDDFMHRIKTTVASSDRVKIHANALCSVR